MRAALIIASMTVAGAISSLPALSQSVYTAGELLSPCQESDNDARWGDAAETECEQYLMGFVGALRLVGAKADLGICAPELNTADEVRWAFMRWVHASYTERTRLPASDAVMATLQEGFPCQ
ncbi:Rap1a/Tai family immunity protein [Ruegeria sp. 2205SS24-7]|uniref:Rap1a/Tai family immunity protein n=1 Tax=Ruegeria discodermiae TaxID=3064389 RepID=UPI0027421F3B|nr:Rap1a/Tai family immunity protein [Ruegeria sp. 2205SS24-7]MDP5220115.1 Rap1a/Tai family immunity protein [Ruegeria sp. 2205SS24-7]